MSERPSSSDSIAPMALLQVFAEEREDAAPCVVGAGFVVVETDDAQQGSRGIRIGEGMPGIVVDLDVVGDSPVGETRLQQWTGSWKQPIAAAETGHDTHRPRSRHDGRREG